MILILIPNEWITTTRGRWCELHASWGWWRSSLLAGRLVGCGQRQRRARASERVWIEWYHDGWMMWSRHNQYHGWSHRINITSSSRDSEPTPRSYSAALLVNGSKLGLNARWTVMIRLPTYWFIGLSANRHWLSDPWRQYWFRMRGWRSRWCNLQPGNELVGGVSLLVFFVGRGL